MSLSVNLILNSERRSGSKISLRSILRISAIILPLVIALFIGQQVLSRLMLNSQLSVLESQWAAAEPKQNYANKQLARLNFNIQTEKELAAWKNTQQPWASYLTAIFKSVPEDIQLTAFRLSADSQTSPPSPPVRNAIATIDGFTTVANARELVINFQKQLQNHSLLGEMLQSVTVQKFEGNPEARNDATRVFTIQCRFKTVPTP